MERALAAHFLASSPILMGKTMLDLDAGVKV
jgi:hypothetical protein